MQSIPWSSGTWTVAPVTSEIEGDSLLVEAVEGSDFWQKTIYGFEHISGHALLAPWDVSTAIEVSFVLTGFTGLYDQAGIMLWAGETQWIKAGIEFPEDINSGAPSLGAVVTDGFSDWSLEPVPEWQDREVTLRASRIGDGVIIRARVEAEPWRIIRVCRFDHANAQGGPMCCGPTRAGFRVRFTRWMATEPDADLHADPPE
jgi:regulation of enolase protein 1 (concanavalin A-like superfamily)